MTPQRLSCADQLPDLLACALTISAEHAPEADLAAARQAFESMLATTRAALPALPARELAQPLLRQMAAMGFAEDDETPRRPQAALLDRVLARRRGVPSMLALLALEFARRLDIPLVAIDFPGRILVRSPAGDHLLDPVGGAGCIRRTVGSCSNASWAPASGCRPSTYVRATDGACCSIYRGNCASCTGTPATPWPR